MTDPKKVPETLPQAEDPAKPLSQIAAQAPSVWEAPGVPVKDAITTPPKGAETGKVTAVHGVIIHPVTLVAFAPGKEQTVEIDDWVKVQRDAGKLKVA